MSKLKDKLTKWQKKRARLLKRQKNLCYYCKAPLVLRGVGLVATTDHIVPLSKGGTHRLANLAASCFKCNHDKDDALPEFSHLPPGLQLEAIYGEINLSSPDAKLTPKDGEVK